MSISQLPIEHNDRVQKMSETAADYNIISEEHWTHKDDVQLFLWEKYVDKPENSRGTVLFVHGSSMASQLHSICRLPGRPFSSVMDCSLPRAMTPGVWIWKAMVDLTSSGILLAILPMEPMILRAASEYIQRLRKNDRFLVYGISSGCVASSHVC